MSGMAKDNSHTNSRHYPHKPDTQGAQRPRINSAPTPYGVSALGTIGSGTFLGGAGGGPGQPQGVPSAGGIAQTSSAIDHLSPDEFSIPGAGAGFATDSANFTDMGGQQGDGGVGMAPDSGGQTPQ